MSSCAGIRLYKQQTADMPTGIWCLDHQKLSAYEQAASGRWCEGDSRVESSLLEPLGLKRTAQVAACSQTSHKSQTRNSNPDPQDLKM